MKPGDYVFYYINHLRKTGKVKRITEDLIYIDCDTSRMVRAIHPRDVSEATIPLYEMKKDEDEDVSKNKKER